MASPFVKAWRELLDSPVMRDDFLCRLWMWCRLRASFRGPDKGSFTTGRHQAAAELEVAPSKWYRGMQRLQALGLVNSKSDSVRTRITVLDYETYVEWSGESEQQIGQRVNSEWTASEQRSQKHPVCIEEGKKVRSAASPAAQSSQPHVAPVLQFPIVGNKAAQHGHEWGLTSAKLAEYKAAFPGIDALAECRKALQWCNDNPSRRKTFDGMPKFLGGWLSRAQDRAGVKGGVPTAVPATDDRVRKNVAAMLKQRQEDEALKAKAADLSAPLNRLKGDEVPVLRFPNSNGAHG